MDGKWIVPGRFEDIDVLYMFEALVELTASIGMYESGDCDLNDIAILSTTIQLHIEDIVEKVGVPKLFLGDH